MACSAAALATPVFTTASRPLPKSTRGVPGVGGPAARRRPARSLAPRASADAASAATALSWPEGAGAAEIGTTKATASVVNLGARGEIATGLPFLDHMIDQLTSHAQLGVSVVVSRDGVASVPCVDASGTDEQDEAVARAAGAALGQALAQTLAPGVAAVAAGAAGSAEFAAPLDEAYSTCVLAVPASGVSSGSLRFELAPYGPEGSNGRARIGTYKTALTEPFWSALATHANLDVTLLKRRGDNAHHIVEATFKAFARCTRAFMDQIEAGRKVDNRDGSGRDGCAERRTPRVAQSARDEGNHHRRRR
jgi:imidazoleglycerol-phosphate dehydratase